MFGIGTTPFDVRLMAFRIPVRVHPSFWVVAALLGWNPNHLDVVFIWVLCMFVSILVHELGHALTAEAFGWPSEIVLYYMGGLAYSERNRTSPARNLTVSIMGPVAGFMLFGLVVCVEIVLDRFHVLESRYRDRIFGNLEFINLYWGLFNLLPVLPFDGGHILQSVLPDDTRVRNPDSLALKIGAVAAGAAAYYFFDRLHQPFMGMMMLFLCIQNFAASQGRAA